MEKKEYLKASLEVIEFRAEKGFATSSATYTEQFGDGSSIIFSSDNPGGEPKDGNGMWDF
ncbi:MAG: hypothetical protein J5605_03445 [Bacteroidales bacterium]|nr:hypothetical protein [Bacteroidales bacterium]